MKKSIITIKAIPFSKLEKRFGFLSQLRKAESLNFTWGDCDHSLISISFLVSEYDEHCSYNPNFPSSRKWNNFIKFTNELTAENVYVDMDI